MIKKLTFIFSIFLLTFSSCCKLVNLIGSRTPKINSANGIASLEKIRLGNIEQTICIRSKDTANPVLLFLHGGPGSPMMPFSHVSDRKLEEDFIVVHWDQRGAGKSYNEKLKPEELKIEYYLADTKELIEYLLERFKKEKLFLLGHSWGSYLGIVTAYNHPELLHAYVGMGQVVNMPEAEMISYNFALNKVKVKKKKKAIKELEQIGSPPYENEYELLTQRKWLTFNKGMIYNRSLFKTIWYSFTSPEYSFRDHSNEFKGRDYLLSVIWPEFQKKSIDNEINAFKIPVYFFEGSHDFCVPSELVTRYIDKISAPHKEIVWFRKSAHMMNIEEPDLYYEILTDKVLKGI